MRKLRFLAIDLLFVIIAAALSYVLRHLSFNIIHYKEGFELYILSSIVVFRDSVRV